MILLQVIVISGCTRDPIDSPPETLLAWTKPVDIDGMKFYHESLTTTPDGGFLVSGYTYHEDNSLTHALVIRFSSGGNRMWWQQYDIDGYSKIYGDNAVQRSDGSIVLTGSCWEDGMASSTFVAFLDEDGNLLRKVLREVPANRVITDRKILLPSDGTILLACQSVNDDAPTLTGRCSLVIDQLTDEGDLTVSREYANTSAILEQTFMNDGGEIFLAGATRPEKVPESLDDLEILFLLIDNAGNEVYRVSGGTNSWDSGLSVAPSYDGGYSLAGMLTYERQPVLFPVSRNGTLGEQVHAADTIHTYGLVIKQINNSEYLLLNQSRTRVYFSKLRSDLSTVWTTWFDNPFTSEFYPPFIRDLVSLNDGSFAFLYFSDETGYTINRTVSFN